MANVSRRFVGTLVLPPLRLTMHPGPQGQPSVVRWTSPVTTTVEVAAHFYTQNGTASGVDVHILVNDLSIFDHLLPGAGDAQSHCTEVEVTPGDTIDFVLGANGNWDSDSTGLDVSIRFSTCDADIAPCEST